MATTKKTAVTKKIVQTKKKKPAAEPVKEPAKEPAAKPEKKVVKKAVKKAVFKKTETPAKPEEVQVPSAEKLEIINKFQVKEGDTGSPEVQTALLTKRIEKLVSHLKTNPSDNHSRRGLLGIVSKRRRLLNYLEKKDLVRYKDVISKLGLSK